MLNTELLDNLYAGLTKEQQQNLITLLFKNSKQTIQRTISNMKPFNQHSIANPINQRINNIQCTIKTDKNEIK